MIIYRALPMYDEYLSAFYAKHQINNAPFEKQMEMLRNDFFSSIDYNWATFNTDTDVQIFETVDNDLYLQQAYCNNSFIYDPDWRKRIVLKQVSDLQPHVCIIYPPEFYNKEFLDQLRERVHHKILIGGYDGMDRKNQTVFNGYDFVITCSDRISSFYRGVGIPSYALEFGFNQKILNSLNNDSKQYKVGFSGSINVNIHSDRLELLKYLVNKTPIAIRSSFTLGRYSLLSRKAIRSIKNGTFADFLSLREIKRRNLGALFGMDMFQFLHDSKISLNLHGDKIKFAANIRLYEATGVGSCLLTDWKENIADIFEPDKEIVTFSSKEEALDKIRFLLKHETVRQRIAEQGQKRTLSQYNEANRIPGAIRFVKELY